MAHRILALVVAAVTGAGCSLFDAPRVDAGPVDAGPLVLAESEPNDGWDRATELSSDVIVEASLGADPARPDVDWYVFRAAGGPRTVDVAVSCPPGADVALEVVDETGTVLAAVNAGGLSAAERLPNLDVPGKAFARVVGLKKGAGGAYTLTARFRPRGLDGELEPNDRRVDATPVAPGQPVVGLVAFPSDVDIYRFELPGAEAAPPPVPEEAPDAGAPPAVVGEVDPDGGPQEPAPALAPPPEPRTAIRIELTPVDDVSLEVQVLTEAEAVLFSARSRPSGPLVLRNVGVRKSDRVLYVMVRSAPVGTGKEARRGFNVDVPYTLSVSQEDAADSAELEPNDDAEHATELVAQTYREGFISPKGDLDYFRILTDGPSVVKVQVSGVERVDLTLSVVEPVPGKEDRVALKANEGGTREPEQLNSVACPGSCLVRVEAAYRKVDGKWVREDENADTPYRLTATAVPDDGSEEKEPNGTPDVATELELGRPVRGTIFPRKDRDQYRLDLSQREVKTRLTATATGVLKVDVGLYLYRVEGDGPPTLVQTADSAKGERAETLRFSAEPGLYVLEVRDTRDREANFQDSYQLTVEDEGE